MSLQQWIYAVIGYVFFWLVTAYGLRWTLGKDEPGLVYGFAVAWPIVWVIAIFAGFVELVKWISSHIHFPTPFAAIDELIWIISRKEIQRDETGILYQGLCPHERTRLEVKVSDGQGTHWMRVPFGFRGSTPMIETAKEAVAWTFNMDHQEYKPVFTS
jgi:hypothetical protein